MVLACSLRSYQSISSISQGLFSFICGQNTFVSPISKLINSSIIDSGLPTMKYQCVEISSLSNSYHSLFQNSFDVMDGHSLINFSQAFLSLFLDQQTSLFCSVIGIFIIFISVQVLKETPTKCYDKFSHSVFSKLLKRFYPIAIIKNIIIIIIVDAQ